MPEAVCSGHRQHRHPHLHQGREGQQSQPVIPVIIGGHPFLVNPPSVHPSTPISVCSSFFPVQGTTLFPAGLLVMLGMLGGTDGSVGSRLSISSPKVACAGDSSSPQTKHQPPVLPEGAGVHFTIPNSWTTGIWPSFPQHLLPTNK